MSKIDLIKGDSIEILKTLPENSVDLLLTDPPYRVSRTGHNKMVSGILKEQKELMRTIPDFEDWLFESYRVLKNDTHAYFFTNFKNLDTMLYEIKKCGFKIHNLLIWQKNNCGFNRWYMKNCEYIIFAWKGKAKKINNGGSKTVHEFKNVKNRLHPTQKPVDLLEFYILNSSNEGDIVLDPFMGSGSTGVACKNLNRDFIGIELEEDYFKIAKERLEQ